MNGAELLVKSLECENVDTVFGYPGVSICPFFDKLTDSKIHPVLVRHEVNAAHEANGYFRSSDKPGVCVSSSGPGATNLITGIATAFADSIPLIVITGQVKSEHIGSDLFQEADIVGACESFVKYSYLVKNAALIPKTVKEAFHIAMTGRKGPVLIDIPVDVLREEGFEFKYPENVNIRTYKPTLKGHSVQIKKIINELSKAQRPIIMVGGGVKLSFAKEEVLEFSRKYNIPFVSTLMGLGIGREDNPLYIGMVGNNGSKFANKAINEADCLIVAGARVADRAVKQPDLITKDKTLIHIDIDPAEIGKNAGPNIPVVGDLKEVFEELNGFEEDFDFSPWSNRINSYKMTREGLKESTNLYVDPKEFVYLLTKELKEESVIVTDVGQNQIYACSNFVSLGADFVTSGGFGCMGFSLPAAIGAKIGNPKKRILSLNGDGAFQMSMAELSTLKQEDLDIKIVIFNNKSLGMIKEYQHLKYNNNYTFNELNGLPYIDKIAEAYDIEYKECKSNKDLKDCIKWLLSSKYTCILELNVDRDAFTCMNL
ncbi:MAG: biosynthetic-type acetolactate synthase large subunit [Lachnospiraceae bacterium]|nr:biosynthetic-type acetolactate synthase large subunit [Lachnospiraceae bacterium]